MPSDNSPSTKLVIPFRNRLATDMVLVVGTLVAVVIAVALRLPTTVRGLFAVLLVFVVPGYLLSVVLFPRGDTSMSSVAWRERDDGGISLLDRLVLTIGLSVSVVVLFGVAFELSGVPLTSASRLAALVALAAVMIPVASYRRRTVPAEERFAPLSDGSSDGLRASAGAVDVLTVVLALSVLFAGGAVAYSIETAGEDAGVTEFYLESDDAGEYPTAFTVGADRTVPLGIENDEGATTTYAVVGELQRVEEVDGELVVRDSQRVYAEDVTLADAETATLDATVTPEATGTYRLTFMVYRGDAPDDPSIDSSYREVHIWITVSEPSS